MSITSSFIVINTQFFGPLEGAAVSARVLYLKLQKCLYAAHCSVTIQNYMVIVVCGAIRLPHVLYNL